MDIGAKICQKFGTITLRCYLYRIFIESKEQLPGDDVRNVLLQMVHTSRYLLLYGNKIRLNVTWFAFNLEFIFCTPYIVRWEVGQFFISTMTLVDGNSYAYWNLDPRLRLNLTFLSFYLSGGPFNSLIIDESRKFFLHCSWKTENDFIFWGQHSTIYFYSNEGKVKMRIIDKDNLHTEVEIVGMFVIFDRDQLIKNVHVNQICKYAYRYSLVVEDCPNPPPVNPEKFKYNINNKYELFRYFISVRKLDKVIIKNITTKTQGFLVFDGSGYLSHTMNATKNVIITSTFQCLVLILITRDKMTDDEHFMFTSKTVSSYNIIANVTNTSGFNIPEEKCRKNLCTLLFFTESGYEINVTAMVVKSTNPYNVNFSCPYAGLIAGEKLDNDYKEK